MSKRVEEKKNNNANLSIGKIEFDESVSDSENGFDNTHKHRIEALETINLQKKNNSNLLEPIMNMYSDKASTHQFLHKVENLKPVKNKL